MQSVDTIQELEALESKAQRGEPITEADCDRWHELTERARFISRVPEATLEEYRALRERWRECIARHNA